MNDFLHRPRKGKTRRFHSNNGNQNNSRRPPLQNNSRKQIPTRLQGAVENLCSLMKTLARNQEYWINEQKKIVDMMECKVVTVEKILDQLNIYSKQSTSQKTTESHCSATKKADTIIEKPFGKLTLVKSPTQKNDNIVKKRF